MSESWRNILERAAGNLSIELDQMAAPAFSHASAVSFRSRRLSPQLSFAESRELLARECSHPAEAHAVAEYVRNDIVRRNHGRHDGVSTSGPWWGSERTGSGLCCVR